MNTNELIQIAADAGKIILENGGETCRAEETINRICVAYGEKNIESFVTPTGIIVSITSPLKNISIVKRISKRTVNLEKIKKVNNLSRYVSSNWMALDDLKLELEEIKVSREYGHFKKLLFAALAASAFTMLFGGNYKDGIVSFLIGLVIQQLSSVLSKININDFFVNISGGAISALIASITVTLGIATNVDKIIIGSIMLLVPGLAITNAIRDTLSGDLVSGIARGIEAFFVAIAIAIGTGVVLKILVGFGGNLL